MPMKWFGPEPFGHLAETNERTPTPTGDCAWCEEPFDAADCGVVLPLLSLGGDAGREMPYHRECFLRMTVGSMAHQAQTCSCHGGTEEDPPGLTRREAAKWALEMFTAMRGPRKD
jgi:hypothetical protein